MAYRLSQRAAQDVDDIYVYGAREYGLPQAEKYHAGLARSFEFLAAYPRAERERKEFTPPVRIHAAGSHVVIYVIEGGDIFIIRVLGGAQDWERHL